MTKKSSGRIAAILLIVVLIVGAFSFIVIRYLPNHHQDSGIPVSETGNKSGKAKQEQIMAQVPVQGQADGHDFVNLGLSVLWATTNLGTTDANPYGDYFGWGEVTEHLDAGLWESYRFRIDGSSNDNVRFSKYNYSSWHGKIDSIGVLDKTDDVAAVEWDGSWRMPTLAEIKELVDSCDWQWTTMDARSGYLVTSRINKATLFLPASGYARAGSIFGVNTSGYYYCSTLNKVNSIKAYSLYFNSQTVSSVNKERYNKYSVRAVYPVKDYVSHNRNNP